jgi:hypothetical protein
LLQEGEEDGVGLKQALAEVADLKKVSIEDYQSQ